MFEKMNIFACPYAANKNKHNRRVNGRGWSTREKLYQINFKLRTAIDTALSYGYSESCVKIYQMAISP